MREIRSMDPRVIPTDSNFAPHANSSDGRDKIIGRSRRWLYLGCAALFFLLGATGAFLPGLPATPFLLLTSYFLVRSSPRLNERLLRSRVFGGILTDWQRRGGVRTHIKIRAILVAIVTVAITLYFAHNSLWFTCVILGLVAVGICVVIRLPNVKRDSPTQDTRAENG